MKGGHKTGSHAQFYCKKMGPCGPELISHLAHSKLREHNLALVWTKSLNISCAYMGDICASVYQI